MAGSHENIDEWHLSDFQKLWDTCCIVAVIDEVDHTANTASLVSTPWGAKSDVPIHYHCEDRSTVDNGHEAFADGDSVAVIAVGGRHTDPTADPELYIVGFSDNKPRICAATKYIAIRHRCTRGGNTSNYYYTVWDIINERVATDVEDGFGGYLSFPTISSNMTYWFTNIVDPVTTEGVIYTPSYDYSADSYVDTDQLELCNAYPSFQGTKCGFPSNNPCRDDSETFPCDSGWENGYVGPAQTVLFGFKAASAGSTGYNWSFSEKMTAGGSLTLCGTNNNRYVDKWEDDGTGAQGGAGEQHHTEQLTYSKNAALTWATDFDGFSFSRYTVDLNHHEEGRLWCEGGALISCNVGNVEKGEGTKDVTWTTKIHSEIFGVRNPDPQSLGTNSEAFDGSFNFAFPLDDGDPVENGEYSRFFKVIGINPFISHNSKYGVFSDGWRSSFVQEAVEYNVRVGEETDDFSGEATLGNAECRNWQNGDPVITHYWDLKAGVLKDPGNYNNIDPDLMVNNTTLTDAIEAALDACKAEIGVGGLQRLSEMDIQPFFRERTA